MKKDNKFGNLVAVGTVIIIMLALVLSLYIVKTNEDDITTNTLKSKNDDDIYNILVLGRDKAAGLCDVVILASINTDSGDICFMQIPRDTYFNCNDATYKKINGAYNSLGSASAMSNAISDALGIKIHYYLSVDLDTVAQMVDMVKGIEVDIPVDMEYSDPSQNLSIQLKAGKQNLDGISAVQFLRYRAGYITGDLGRIDAQKLFLNAFAKKVAEIGNPFSLYKVFKLVCNKGETNIKEKDLVSIGLKCSKAKGGTVYYVTAPGEAIQTKESGAWYYILSSSAMNDLLASRFEQSESFDKNNRFVNKNDQSFLDIYNKKCEVKIYTSDDIEKNNISIN